jgi:hypothetical protein
MKTMNNCVIANDFRLAAQRMRQMGQRGGMGQRRGMMGGNMGNIMKSRGFTTHMKAAKG